MLTNLTFWAFCLMGFQTHGVKVPAAQQLLEHIDRTAVTLSFNQGDLQLFNLYLLQAKSLLTGGDEREVRQLMLEQVYEPYKDFWHILYKNKSTFKALTQHYVLVEEPPITHQLPAILDVDVSAIFAQVAEGMIAHTGHRPKGRWYLIWATGQFDIGVPEPGVAILDWGMQKPTREALEVLFPHEFSHLIHRELAVPDPHAGTVLDWSLKEGFAVYVAYRYWQGKYGAAACLQYTEEQWQWALDNEQAIKNKARPLLFSKKAKDVKPFKSGAGIFIAGGPSRIGYFLGFRMLQAYVDRHGPDSWRQAYQLPVQKILDESAYFK